MALIDDIKKFFPITSSTKDNERHQLNQLMSSVIQYLEDLPETASAPTTYEVETAPTGDYLEEVYSDSTLTGKGTPADVLSVDHSSNVVALTDVTVAGTSVLVHMDNDRYVYTLRATEDFVINSRSSSGNLHIGMLYVFNDSPNPITMSMSLFTLSPILNPDIPPNSTASYLIYAHGKVNNIINMGGAAGDITSSL